MAHDGSITADGVAFSNPDGQRIGDEVAQASRLDLLVIPLFACISIARSQILERLVTTVAGHRPLVEALRSGDRARIREEFYEGATSAYGIFLSASPERELASAFGDLQTEA